MKQFSSFNFIALIAILLFSLMLIANQQLPLGKFSSPAPPEIQSVQIQSNENIYVYGADKVVQLSSAGIKYFHNDYLNTPRIETSASKNAVAQNNQYPFGEKLSQQGTEKYIFTGKELDKTNLQYFGARFYAPETGRFTQVDPAGTGYSYSDNSPLRFIDPAGNEPSEAQLRTWNVGVSAAFPLLTGIIHGDSITDIAKNTVIGAAAGLGSFETKRYASSASRDVEFLGAGLAENFFSSVRANAMQNKPPLSDLKFDYLMFTFSVSNGNVEPGINVARTLDFAWTFANIENELNIGKSLATGVPIFERASLAPSLLTGDKHAGQSSLFGGAISYYTGRYASNERGVFGHEFIHNLQGREQFSVGSGVGLRYNPKVHGFRLYGLENVAGGALTSGVPYVIQGASNDFQFGGNAYYESDWDWVEREAYSLDRKP